MTSQSQTDSINAQPTTGHKIAAELIGTFALVLFGVGAALMSGGDYVATGLSFGLVVLVMAAAMAHVSGGHFNPAVTLAVTDRRARATGIVAPAAIGMALAIIHFASMGATGTSVNPARSIGPALFAGTDAMAQLWLFVAAPLLGAAIAGLSYAFLFGKEPLEVDPLA